jgi:hypothetical protein
LRARDAIRSRPSQTSDEPRQCWYQAKQRNKPMRDR